jgi:hypothetical protein
LNFNSSKDDSLAFIEEFGKFVNRELPSDGLKNSLMMLLLNACTKDDTKAHSFSESLMVDGTPNTLEELKKKFIKEKSIWDLNYQDLPMLQWEKKNQAITAREYQ